MFWRRAPFFPGIGMAIFVGFLLFGRTGCHFFRVYFPIVLVDNMRQNLVLTGRMQFGKARPNVTLGLDQKLLFGRASLGQSLENRRGNLPTPQMLPLAGGAPREGHLAAVSANGIRWRQSNAKCVCRPSGHPISSTGSPVQQPGPQQPPPPPPQS